MDLDLGNYERFMDIKLTRDNNITTGKIYQASVWGCTVTFSFHTSATRGAKNHKIGGCQFLILLYSFLMLDSLLLIRRERVITWEKLFRYNLTADFITYFFYFLE